MCLTVVVGLIAVGIGFLSYWSLKPHITDTSHTSDMAGQEDLVKTASSIFEFTVDGLDGQQVPLSDFKGKVTLIVNTASG
eukprot:m.126619 g.126619  ORF g.126619 m.126619 type:complete len:80 (-) comp13838_c0_seq2:1552-1791(-)